MCTEMFTVHRKALSGQAGHVTANSFNRGQAMPLPLMGPFMTKQICYNVAHHQRRPQLNQKSSVLGLLLTETLPLIVSPDVCTVVQQSCVSWARHLGSVLGHERTKPWTNVIVWSSSCDAFTLISNAYDPFIQAWWNAFAWNTLNFINMVNMLLYTMLHSFLFLL